MNIDISKIRALDYGFSTDISIFSFIEKWAINGFWKAVTDNKQQLPTHIFQFIDVEGDLQVIEMAADGNDKKKLKLSLCPIDKYLSNGIFGDRIICVLRNSLYDDDLIRAQANKRHLRRWADGKTFYDISELTFFMPFLRFLGLKNDNSKLVCSSEAEDELNKDECTFSDFPLLKKPQGVIAPWQIMDSKFCITRSGNRHALQHIV